MSDDRLDGMLVIGQIRTLDADNPAASAMAVWGEQIVDVGDEESCRRALVNRSAADSATSSLSSSSSLLLSSSLSSTSLRSSVDSFSSSPFVKTAWLPAGSYWYELSVAELERIGAYRLWTTDSGHRLGELTLSSSAVVLPSFHDSHCHPAAGGLQMIQCNLRQCSSAAEALAVIADFADALRASADDDDDKSEVWLCGGGWQPQWFVDETPTAALLDSACADLPAYLRDINGHELWTNTLGLRRAGIDAETPDPPTGVIKKDALSGQPVGHLLEEATRLVARVLPPLPQRRKDAGLLYALKELARHGVTSVHDAAVTPSLFQTYLRAARRFEQLPVSVFMALQWGCVADGDDVAANLRWLRERRHELRQRAIEPSASPVRLHAEAVKIFLDGLPENCTAAMHQPYARTAGRPGQHTACGKLNYSVDQLRRIVAALSADGFQIHMHALGDAAVSCALDALESLPPIQRLRQRNIVAHVQFLSPADLRRFRQLAVVVNMSPFWFQLPVCELAALNVGLPRGADQYVCRSIVESGARLCFGSDWPVSSLVPLEGIQVAVTRRPLAPTDDDRPWNYDQAIDIDQAVHSYTSGSAYANYQEDQVGRLAKHYIADFVVVSPDPYTVDVADIHKCNVQATFIAGSPTFIAPSSL